MEPLIISLESNTRLFTFPTLVASDPKFVGFPLSHKSTPTIPASLDDKQIFSFEGVVPVGIISMPENVSSLSVLSEALITENEMVSLFTLTSPNSISPSTTLMVTVVALLNFQPTGASRV